MKYTSYQSNTNYPPLKLICFDIGKRMGIAKADLKSKLAEPVKTCKHTSIIKMIALEKGPFPMVCVLSYPISLSGR